MIVGEGRADLTSQQPDGNFSLSNQRSSQLYHILGVTLMAKGSIGCWTYVERESVSNHIEQFKIFGYTHTMVN